jgi:hypothetical protein
MLPLIIAAAAVVLLAGGKKKKASSTDGGTDTRPSTPTGPSGMFKVATTDNDGEPWDYCKPPGGSKQFTFSAYGKDRKCMVFWDASTRPIAKAHFENEMAKLSEDERIEVCALGECIPDPMVIESEARQELLCNWEDNPKSVELITKVVLKMYPQLSIVQFPLPYSLDNKFFPSTVWTLVSNTFFTDICGYNKVT